MIELCCKYLSVRCIWQYVIIMGRKTLRVNSHYTVYLNAKEPFALSRWHIWSLIDNNEIRTQSQLVRKRALNCLDKLGKWLSAVVITYLYGAFVCMLLSCHVIVSE